MEIAPSPYNVTLDDESLDEDLSFFDQFQELVNEPFDKQAYFNFFLDLSYNDEADQRSVIDYINEVQPSNAHDLISAFGSLNHAKSILRTNEVIGVPEQERVLETFFWIAAKKYYSPDELKALFSEIEIRKGTGEHAAKREGSRLVLFDVIFGGEGNQAHKDEDLEYYVLHEAGHIIDTSKVLDLDNQIDSLDEDYESEMARIVAEIPSDLQDNYSRSMGELGVSEAIAHITAVWSKHQNDFDGFFFERMMRTNTDGLIRIFGSEQNLAEMCRECKDKDDRILVMRRYIKDENLFNALFENSHQIFNHLNHGWSAAKLSLGKEFYDRLASVDEEGYDSLYGSTPDLMPEPDASSQMERGGSENSDYSQSTNAANHSGNIGASPSSNTRDASPAAAFGEVFSAGADLIKSFDDLNIFN